MVVASSGLWPATPRIPSVPNSFFMPLEFSSTHYRLASGGASLLVWVSGLFAVDARDPGADRALGDTGTDRCSGVGLRGVAQEGSVFVVDQRVPATEDRKRRKRVETGFR